jgi:hypothetical protein
VPRVRPAIAAIRSSISSTLIAAVSVARGLALHTAGTPRTPLRVLCIAAIDTLHTIRRGKRLPTPVLKVLAALLDFGACMNETLDRKVNYRGESRVTRQLLEDAGGGRLVAEYVRRLGDLEGRRPPPGGGRCQFERVRRYREAVVRLSLGTVATAAGCQRSLDEAVEATDSGDLNLLFRIAMQCQVVDDVLDYSRDWSAGLPSFLTACGSLPQALELTGQTARGYAEARRGVPDAGLFPLRAALLLVSTCVELVVSLRRIECHSPRNVDHKAN